MKKAKMTFINTQPCTGVARCTKHLSHSSSFSMDKIRNSNHCTAVSDSCGRFCFRANSFGVKADIHLKNEQKNQSVEKQDSGRQGEAVTAC